MVTGIDNTEPPAVEARSRPRRRMLKHVQVLSLDRKAASAIDLTLRNASSTGAQLFGPPEAISRLADEFYLMPPGQLRMIRCKLVWRTEDLAGVSYVSDHGAPAGAGGPGAPETYVLDHTTGAVVKRDQLLSGRAPDDGLGSLERAVSEALGLKVEIAAIGNAGGRVSVHVRTEAQLRDVCRRLARPD